MKVKIKEINNNIKNIKFQNKKSEEMKMINDIGYTLFTETQNRQHLDRLEKTIRKTNR